MFLNIQARPEANMLDFFAHENQQDPPSLSDNDKLYQGAKSCLLECLPGMPKPGKNKAADNATALMLDMPAVIHMVQPKRATQFSEYTPMHLLPFIDHQKTGKCTRVDGLWDRYDPASVKNQIRIIRGGTSQRRNCVSGSLPIPKGKDWQRFLNDSGSKTELFGYLSKELRNQTSDKNYILLTTHNGYVPSSKNDVTLESLQPSTHEEADTRIFLHLNDAVENGHSIIKIRTVDTDVIVIAISVFHQLPQLKELWVGFGSGKSYRDIPIHKICELLGPERSEALPVFHALTGCDYTSFLRNIGKKTAWKTWQDMPEMTQTFIKIKNNPESVTIQSPEMTELQIYFIANYSKNCAVSDINEARQHMFTTGLKTLESIPPTKNALFQHVKRAMLTCGFMWKMCLEKSPNIPNPKHWGWEWNNRVECWVPYWTDLPDVSKGCSLLVKCGCHKSCQGNCKCFKMGIRCSPLCNCNGSCVNNDRFY